MVIWHKVRYDEEHRWSFGTKYDTMRNIDCQIGTKYDTMRNIDGHIGTKYDTMRNIDSHIAQSMIR